MSGADDGAKQPDEQVGHEEHVEQPDGATGPGARARVGSLARAAGQAARRARDRGSVVAAQVREDERVGEASRKVGAVLADERTKALLAASARAGARAAADVFASRGSAGMAAAMRTLADDGTATTGAAAGGDPPAVGRADAAGLAPACPAAAPPSAAEIAELLAARRADRAGRAPSGPALERPVARVAPPTAADLSPLVLRLDGGDAFRVERHPGLDDLTVEVSPAGGEQVLSVEWRDVAPRLVLRGADIPTRWVGVEAGGTSLPLRMRRSGSSVEIEFLGPPPGSAPASPSSRTGLSEGALRAALSRTHDDSMAVIRNLHA